MREQPALQSASVRLTAAAFSIPVHHLRRAVALGELKTHCTGGRTALLIFDDVKEWIRQHPSPRRPFKQEQRS